MDDEHVEPFIICQMIQRFGDWVAESLWEEVEPEEVMPDVKRAGQPIGVDADLP